ncbi:MAG: [Oscillospiraceae bacterium]|nr:[FeFe] hydrogenase H-cluster radical SAM maturase HydE [Oscillospiraceae bacterium]
MHDPITSLITKLSTEHRLSAEGYAQLLTTEDPAVQDALITAAVAVRKAQFGNGIFLRGLIELTNYCKNNCYYCGIRRDNKDVMRYRMSHQAVLDCCQMGAELGFRTFVLQGGEDPYWNDARLCALITDIKARFPQCAVTVSLGERSEESYRALRDAGADRYLLRHETADSQHYAMLHPPEMSLANRMRCLRTLKSLGYQTGCGMMVGSPYQTIEHLVKDLQWIEALQPETVGIGPFLPHHATPFAAFPAGSAAMTLRLLSIVRLMLPTVLLPATTALGTLLPDGLEQGILAGANVIMPNLTPNTERCNYQLYDGKCTAAKDTLSVLRDRTLRFAAIGYETVHQRGDAPSFLKP